MAEYIDKELVQMVLKNKRMDDCESCTDIECLDCLAEFIGLLKPADVAPVKRGEWIPIYHKYINRYETVDIADEFACSICGRKARGKYNYCHCGADMRKE